MNPDLYFIPLLFAAYRAEGRGEAIRLALEEIRMLGREERHRNGYAQFLVFMQAVRSEYLKRPEVSGAEHPIDHDAPVELEEIGALDEYENLFDAQVFEDALIHVSVSLVLTASNQPRRVVRLSGSEPSVSIPAITPGHYQLGLSTGQIIWEAELRREHVLSGFAFPDEPVRFAADTGSLPRRASVDERLLDGEIEVRVFPGRDNATMEVSLCAP
ncbi:MAG: hypothetical protein AMXMBFR84_48150 [Candidatus Hydrogenedentota bacterium]